MLLPRVITAIIGLPVIISAIYFGGLPYFLFIFIIIMFSLYEYFVIMKLALKPVEKFTFFIFGALIPIFLYMNGTNFGLPLYNFIPFIISLIPISAIIYELFAGEKYIERIAYTIFGLFFISWNLSHLILIRDLRPDGRIFTFMTFITVWIMDTSAYFVGKKMGKNKLSPVSPKKTVEGFFAGFFSAIIVIFLFRNFIDSFSVLDALISGIIIGIAGQLSDLAESLIKRVAGVKDSSNILPGHGGILDRFDSYIFIAPILYYYIVFTRL